MLTAIFIGFCVVKFGQLSQGEGMILAALPAFWDRIADAVPWLWWLPKVTYLCPYCMANPLTWGGLAYLSAARLGFIGWGVPEWLIFCVCVSGGLWLIKEITEGLAPKINF